MKSWKTTLFGALTAACAAVAALPDMDSTVVKICSTAAPIFAGLVGLFARDNKVTSEQAGAVK